LGGAARPIDVSKTGLPRRPPVLTQDEDFLFGEPTDALVVVSPVRQARRVAERVEIWHRAILDLTQNPRPERRFELMDDGALVAWEQRSPGVWTASPPRPKDRQD